MIRTGKQVENEERFTAHTVDAILKLLEGQPARLAISVLDVAKGMIQEAAHENAVRAEACLDANGGIIRWWLAQKESGQLREG